MVRFHLEINGMRLSGRLKVSPLIPHTVNVNIKGTIKFQELSFLDRMKLTKFILNGNSKNGGFIILD